MRAQHSGHFRFTRPDWQSAVSVAQPRGLFVTLARPAVS
jgi:hypothetical protein